jgi:hypothetical protein
MRCMTLVFVVALGLATSVAAQDLTPGRYSMEWSNLHVPVSSDLPDLTTGVATVDIVQSSAGCPPTTKWEVRGAPVGGTTWCVLEGGAFDSSVGPLGPHGGIQVWMPNGTGGFDMFHVEAEHGSRASDTVHAVGRRMSASPTPTPTTPAPTTGTFKVAMTSPANLQQVSGYNWPVGWMEQTTSTNNRFEVLVDGVVRGSTTISAKGPASIRWDTKAVPNGDRKLRLRGTTLSDGKSVLSNEVTIRVTN